jgi:hypothetical protein
MSDRRISAQVTHPATTTLALGTTMAVTNSCTDGGSGIATCTGPAALETSNAGAFTATVKITGGVRSLTVRLQPGVARVVQLKPKKKHAKTVSLKLVTTAGTLHRTERKTVRLRP